MPFSFIDLLFPQRTGPTGPTGPTGLMAPMGGSGPLDPLSPTEPAAPEPGPLGPTEQTAPGPPALAGAQEPSGPPGPTDSDDPFVEAQRFINSGNELLESYRKAREITPDPIDIQLNLDPGINELRDRYTEEMSRLPEDRYREKIEGFNQRLRSLKSGLSAIGSEIAHMLAVGPSQYEPPITRFRQEAQREYETARPMAQQLVTASFNASRALLSAQLKAQQLQQQAEIARERNDLQAAQAYGRLAEEHRQIAEAAQRSQEISARLGLTRLQAQKVQEEIARSSVTYGLRGLPGFVLAISKLPESERERVLGIYRETTEAGRDPLRALRLQESLSRPKGPFVPLRDSRGDIHAFYSPADNVIVNTPTPLSDRPDTDQKAIDRGNLIVVLRNLSTLRRMHKEYMDSIGKSPSGPITGALALAISRWNLPAPGRLKDQAAAISQMNGMARHATRTMIYLMSGKAVSEREAQDFESIMPQLTIGAKDFEVRLATMLATIAAFAEVRFRQGIDEILREEAKLSPQLAPDLMEVASEVGKARQLSRVLYYSWQRIAPQFAERYRDVLMNPSLAASTEGPDPAARFRRSLEEFKKSIEGKKP